MLATQLREHGLTAEALREYEAVRRPRISRVQATEKARAPLSSFFCTPPTPSSPPELRLCCPRAGGRAHHGGLQLLLGCSASFSRGETIARYPKTTNRAFPVQCACAAACAVPAGRLRNPSEPTDTEASFGL